MYKRQGEDILIPGIMEHIERAGIHSGDSIDVYKRQVAIFLAVPYLQKKSKTSFKKVAKMNLKANKANGGSDNA